MLVRLRMTIYWPFLERSAFERNEESAGRLDVELLRVVALVDGNADAAARIDEQKRIAHGDIHESFHVREGHRFLVDFDPEFVAEVVAQLLEFVNGNIREQGTEGVVETDDVAGDALVGDGGSSCSEAFAVRNLGDDEIVIPSGGEVRGRSRKDIAAMKSGRNGGLNHPVWIGDLACGIQAVAIHHGGDQAIVRKNKKLSLFLFDDDSFARGTYSGVD